MWEMEKYIKQHGYHAQELKTCVTVQVFEQLYLLKYNVLFLESDITSKAWNVVRLYYLPDF